MTSTLYYASDVHGSDLLWKKFINAGKFYRADVLVMGGDITGKAVVPIIDTGNGFLAEEVNGKEPFDEEQLPAVEKRIRDIGFYPYRVDESELAAMRSGSVAVENIFLDVMRESIARWMRIAEERLAGTDIKLFVMIGNDDDESLREVIADSPVAVDPEDIVVELGEGFEMYSCGWTHPSPWKTPRELPEEELEPHLEEHLSDMTNPERAVFNFHAPPYGTSLDRAANLDENLKPIVRGGQVEIISVGSKAVRAVIERHQPALALHGHIHESRGVARIGRTLCINTGSAYAEGVLHGALIMLDRKKGVRRHALVSG